MITQFMKLKYIDELNINPTFSRVIMPSKSVNLFTYFWDDLKARIYSKTMNNFYCIFIYGEQGTAKSGIGLALATELLRKNTKMHITFDDSQLIKKVASSRPGDTFIRDETQKSFGVGTLQMQSNIENFVYQLRERRNNFIFICPENLKPNGFHHYIRCILFHEELMMVKTALINPKTNNYLGYVWFDLRDHWNNKVWRDYKNQKETFLSNVVENKYDKFNSQEIAEEIFNHKEFDITLLQDNNGIIQPSWVKDYVYEVVGNLTSEQTKMVYRKLIIILLNKGHKIRGFKGSGDKI